MKLFDADGREIQQPDIRNPQGVSPDDAILLARMVEEIRALDADDICMAVAVGPLAAVQLVGLLQLALRHGGTAGNIRDTAEWFIENARDYFADCPAVLEVLRRGDDPNDRTEEPSAEAAVDPVGGLDVQQPPTRAS